MSILNSLPKKIGIATEGSNGLMSASDKVAVNKINRIEADVANKLSKDVKIKSSQLDTSSDLVKIQPENLSNEVKAMMTGKAAVSPNISYKSLVTEHYADSSVTSAKRTPAGSVAVIVSTEFCDFDTTNDTEVVLSIPGNYTVYFGIEQLTVTDMPESLTFEKGVPSVIVYNKLDGFNVYSETAVSEQDFIVGAFDGTSVVMFNGRYTVNGSVVVGDNSLTGSAIKDFSMDSRKLAIQHGTILADVSKAPFINVNFTSKFVEAVKEFDINIADQYVMNVRNTQECIIPENPTNSKYLYIYYDLGSRRLNALWSSSDINETILVNDEKLVLLGIVYDKKVAVGLNDKYISVNSISTKNKAIEYTDILSGEIVIDLLNKKIEGTDVMAFIDNSVVTLVENSHQVITLTDDVTTNITNGIPYTLASVRNDFDSNIYRLVFDLTENIRSMGLDFVILASIKGYNVSYNKDNIKIIKQDGNVVKSDNIISIGYTLPIDDETVVAELSTVIDEGNLILTSVTKPGTSVIDPMTNTRYDITASNKYEMVVENLHGLYSVLFNTESNKIEILPQTNTIDKRKYISLGFVSELSDSVAYTAAGNIVNHITLNSNRPSNYSVIDGPDPDKGYDWSNNRLVLPEDIYLLKNTQYNLYCQNMSMNKYIDNDYINYELALPNGAVITENAFTINVPVEGSFKSMVAGKFKGNNNCLFKDVNLHFKSPNPKELTVLCIGDDTVDMNMPGYIKQYLSSYGYTPTMLGTVNNGTNVNGYGLVGLENEYGEGHRGWRMTDFMCRTLRRDGSTYYMQNNPFMNNSEFDFVNYMESNAYSNVDVVVISLGLNDITGYHTATALEDIQTPSIYQNIEQLPNMYKEMITSIHKFDPNIKIIINPPMIKGIDDDYNRKALMLTEVLVYDLKDIENVYFAPGYLTQPLFAGANSASIANYAVTSDVNNTKLGTSVNTSDINGMAQSNLAYMITSTIIGVTK